MKGCQKNIVNGPAGLLTQLAILGDSPLFNTFSWSLGANPISNQFLNYLINFKEIIKKYHICIFDVIFRYILKAFYMIVIYY